MEVEFGRLKRNIRRFWWVVAIAAVVTAGIVGGISSMLPSTYTAKSWVLVVPPSVSGTSVTSGSVTTYIQLATTQTTRTLVNESLESDWTQDEFEGAVRAVQVPGSTIVEITATTDDPQKSADLANGVSDALVSLSREINHEPLDQRRLSLVYQSEQLQGQITTLDARISTLETSEDADETQAAIELDGLKAERLRLAQSKADIDGMIRAVELQIAVDIAESSVVQTAEPPTTEDGLSPVIFAILGAFVGAFAGAAALLIKTATDRTIVSEDQVEALVGAAPAAVISRASLGDGIGWLDRLAAGDGSRVGIVSPRRSPQLDVSDGSIGDQAMTVVNGFLDNDEATTALAAEDGVLIAISLGKTTVSDVKSTMSALRIMRLPVIGSVVVR